MPQNNIEQLNKLEEEVSGLKNIINDLQKEITDLQEIKNIIRNHRHLGIDGSSLFTGDTEFRGKNIHLSGGQRISGMQSAVLAPLNIYDNIEQNPDGSTPKSILKRVFGFAIGIAGDKGSASEQINSGIIAGLSLESEDIKFSDFDRLNLSQLRLIHVPQDTGQPPLAFLNAQRTPLVSSKGSVTNVGSTLTDSSASYKTNVLTGCILVLYSGGVISEAYRIASNTSTVITISGNWVSATGTYDYYVFGPVFLGSAESPWRRLFVGDEIRLAYGASAGTQVRWIRWGNGSPEGVVAASVGSLFLRFDGGAGTTLYVKQSGTDNTGWIGK